MNETIKTSEELTKLPNIDLLNYLFNLARPSQLTVDQLQQEGWESIYSFKPFEPNGTVSRTALELSIEEIGSQVALSDNYWQLCTAKKSPEQEPDPFERDHVYYVLRKHEVENTKK